MASILTRGKSQSIQYYVGKKRRTLPLGGISTKAVQIVRYHVEHILAAQASGQPLPIETAQWVAGQKGELLETLIAFGLVIQRHTRTVEIGPYVDELIKRRTDLKPRTITNMQQARNKLTGYFGRTRDMRSITRGDAKDWRRWLEKDLSGPTVAMHVKKARQFFADAVDRSLIAENPFKGIKAGDQSNKDRLEYVPAKTVDAVIDACPDIEWKLLFALGRYQGMRIPSETSLLTWADINWELKRITIRAPKTERHTGKGRRLMPIHPKTLELLREAFAKAEEGQLYVLPQLRRENLRTRADKIIDRSGVTPWGKPFQNLRSSCETDLANHLPAHVVCAWIGNTEAVARKHYLQVLDEHFEAVSGPSAANCAADNRGQDRTAEPKKTQNPQKSEDSAKETYPQGESNSLPSLAEKLRKSEKALLKALLRKQGQLPRLRAHSLRRLGRHVAAAKSRHPRKDQ